MRQLTTSSLPAARPHWRRTAPRWLRPAIRYSAALSLAIALSGGALWSWRSGALAAAYGHTVTGAVLLSGELGLRVGDVQVEGRHETQAGALLAALGVRRGMPILALDLAGAKARLEALPWVRSASVERRWPHLVFVRIEERTPLALWQNQDRIKVIDQEGTVIEGADIARFASLPMVVGPEAPKQTPALLAMLAKQPALARHVAAAVWVGKRRWNLHLQEGIDVRLPELGTEDALARLAGLEAKEQLFARDIVMIDLRMPDRLIVRLSPEAAARQLKPAKPGKSGKST
jgi:cell division protein FtsQ